MGRRVGAVPDVHSCSDGETIMELLKNPAFWIAVVAVVLVVNFVWGKIAGTGKGKLL
jgi:hypothetical protein